MSNPVKGTVTSLSSLYSPHDTQKASLRVQETITEHDKNIQKLQSFLNENNTLINLVKKLPDKLNHDIMSNSIKGTVTSLSSLYSPQDAQKASQRVQETITEHDKNIQQLQSFLNENNTLINLVKKLPDKLNHDIMVPFGKAAFFPGKLIHTNEFLVLLGEGYYADRTSKQTIEILKRRGKDLESQIENLNGIIKDLKFEASFFDETATEAAEGIVEIREEYVEETPNEDEATTAGEDDFARILSRMEELEKEELENEELENEELESEVAEEGEDLDTADLSHLMSRTSFETEAEAKNEHLTSQGSLLNHTQQDVSKPFKPKDSPAFPVSKDSHVKVPTSSGSGAPPRLVEHNKSKNSWPPTPVSKNEVPTSASSSSNDRSKASAIAPASKEVSNEGSRSTNDSSKAFTGSIVERTHNLDNNQKGQTPAALSKPVSRFKMQRK